MAYILAELFGQAAPLMAIGGLITALWAALAFMASSVSGDDKLKAWAKSELSELVSAFFLIVMFIMFTIVADTALNAALPYMDPFNGPTCLATANQNRPCLMILAQNYLELTYRASRDVAQEIMLQNSFVNLMASISVSQESMTPPWTYISAQPLAGYSFISDTLSTAFGLLIKVMMLQRIQQFFLGIIEQGIFPVLFIAGCVLYMPSFTRKLGGLLIGIAMGCYFIYPLTYAAAGYLLFSVNDPTGAGLLGAPRQSHILQRLTPNGAMPSQAAASTSIGIQPPIPRASAPSRARCADGAAPPFIPATAAPAS